MAVVSRLTGQKGLDLLAAAIPDAVKAGARFAILGSGEPALEAAFKTLAKAHPGAVGARIGYDEALSHRIFGGADVILVPSRFEPCGLTQLYGLRYGTLPLVARTGGLADSVIDANEAALARGVATGFQFQPVTLAALSSAIGRAIALFGEQVTWRKLMKNAMAQKVDWSASAEKYSSLYRQLTA
jgi:starch synthase